MVRQRVRSANPFLCLDCGADTGEAGLNEYYMVHDPVWAATGLRPDDGMLCIGCLEKRIGRELTGADFRICFINRWGSRRMMARMAR